MHLGVQLPCCSASTVRDLSFVHGRHLIALPKALWILTEHHPEGAQKMGIWTMCIGSAPYISLVVDGFVTTYAGWRWIQWLTLFCGLH